MTTDRHDLPAAADEIAHALDGLGLQSPGLSRDMEFHVGCGEVADEAIARIEAMMGDAVAPEHRALLHAVVERVANGTGPQLTITLGR